MPNQSRSWCGSSSAAAGPSGVPASTARRASSSGGRASRITSSGAVAAQTWPGGIRSSAAWSTPTPGEPTKTRASALSPWSRAAVPTTSEP
ncbi:hypothetical protein AB0F68_17345 [Micromonospora sp. NPDC023966]|uniref:hypothetical protein n=1 Tax=Micromonospora sp. NPDC023966 TaxID=3154699 RepID=UPI00340D438C